MKFESSYYNLWLCRDGRGIGTIDWMMCVWGTVRNDRTVLVSDMWAGMSKYGVNYEI